MTLTPGPLNAKNWQCCLLYLNVQEFHGNLHELTVASKRFDILLCSETLVSSIKHYVKLFIPGFERPILLKFNEINRTQGMTT